MFSPRGPLGLCSDLRQNRDGAHELYMPIWINTAYSYRRRLAVTWLALVLVGRGRILVAPTIATIFTRSMSRRASSSTGLHLLATSYLYGQPAVDERTIPTTFLASPVSNVYHANDKVPLNVSSYRYSPWRWKDMSTNRESSPGYTRISSSLFRTRDFPIESWTSGVALAAIIITTVKHTNKEQD
jgi:hypothetical protein